MEISGLRERFFIGLKGWLSFLHQPRWINQSLIHHSPPNVLHPFFVNFRVRVGRDLDAIYKLAFRQSLQCLIPALCLALYLEPTRFVVLSRQQFQRAG